MHKNAHSLCQDLIDFITNNIIDQVINFYYVLLGKSFIYEN